MRAEHQHAQVGEQLHNGTQRFQFMHMAQAKIQDEDIGAGGGEDLEGAGQVGSFSNDSNLRIRRQNLFYAFTHQLMVVGNYNLYHLDSMPAFMRIGHHIH